MHEHGSSEVAIFTKRLEGEDTGRTSLGLINSIPAIGLTPMVLTIMWLKFGYRPTPSIFNLQSLAENWRHPYTVLALHGDANYLLSSPTSAIVAGVLHLTGYRAFFSFHLGLVAICVVTSLLLFSGDTDGPKRLGVAALWIGSAVGPVLSTWIGSYDPASVMGLMFAVLPTNRWLRRIGWTVAFFNNISIALLASLALIVVGIFRNRRAPSFAEIMDVMIGLIVGVTLISAYVILIGHGSVFARVSYLSHQPYSVYTSSIKYLLPTTFSALGVGWYFVVTIRDGRAGWVALGVFAMLYSIIVPFIATDVSRVIALSLLPAELWLIKQHTSQESDVHPTSNVSIGEVYPLDDVRPWISALFLAVLVPVVLTWSGSLFVNSL